LKSLDGEVPKSKKLTIYINAETTRGVIQMERSIVTVIFFNSKKTIEMKA